MQEIKGSPAAPAGPFGREPTVPAADGAQCFPAKLLLPRAQKSKPAASRQCYTPAGTFRARPSRVLAEYSIVVLANVSYSQPSAPFSLAKRNSLSRGAAAGGIWPGFRGLPADARRPATRG